MQKVMFATAIRTTIEEVPRTACQILRMALMVNTNII